MSTVPADQPSGLVESSEDAHDAAMWYQTHRGVVLRRLRQDDLAFRKLVRDQWGGSLDVFLLYLGAVGEITTTLHDQMQAATMHDHAYQALLRLQTRALQVARSIYDLLTVGQIDSARARSRTLHEVAVTGKVISLHPSLGERYLHHGIAQRRRDLEVSAVHAANLGRPQPDSGVVTESDRLLQEEIDRHGRQFESLSYGWAHPIVTRGWPGLVSEAGLEHMEPYYRLASHEIHADATAVASSRAHSDGSVRLDGRSLAGLDDVACVARAWVYATTYALVRYATDMVPTDESIQIMTLDLLIRDTHDELHARGPGRPSDKPEGGIDDLASDPDPGGAASRE